MVKAWWLRYKPVLGTYSIHMVHDEAYHFRVITDQQVLAALPVIVPSFVTPFAPWVSIVNRQ